METMPGTRAPVRMWIDPLTVEHAALNQVRNVGNMPWTHGVALMPDAHYGKGATVGSVIAMRDAVSPAAVGVDIGCGMSAVRVDLTASQLPDDLSKVRAAIEAAVPVGQSSHNGFVDTRPLPEPITGKSGLSWDQFWAGYDNLTMTIETRRLNTSAYRERVMSQIGTLGGGNHFIELCLDDDGGVWLMLHSGSRNVGKELAERHIAVAKELPHNADLPDRDLAVFMAGTPEMDAYRRDLFWAQEYARRNRAVMMGLVKRAVRGALGIPLLGFGETISCHHNYVSEETYDGLDLLITRKGAISTEGGRLGIIPGSMGTGSYIVRGKGNPAAYCSASHGAGRRMSRGQAKRQFTVEDLQAQTAGVECRKDEGVVDEIPGAYKNLEEVMSQQTDLVEVVERLRTIVCVKG
jgi:tRNA-splicing ligase RtcB